MPPSDPLFQHTLASTIRSSKVFQPPSNTKTTPETWNGLPVIHDEVFTGLFRLGEFSSSTFIQTHPDISVHAKLLTGGLVPLCCTVASQSIFEAFLGDEKRDALLHGHSYTAHPVGCHVANKSIEKLVELQQDGSWDAARKDWTSQPSLLASTMTKLAPSSGAEIWSVWSRDFISQISYSKEVESVITLGSVLAINLQDENAGEYLNPHCRVKAKFASRVQLNSSNWAAETTSARYWP